MLHKSYLYNVLAEGMYFWTKVAYHISPFWTFHLSEVVQISHVIFEIRSQFLYKFCHILYIISSLKYKCKV